MTEIVEQVRVVDKDKMPEEISEFESLGLNERHELVGTDAEGNQKRVTGVGALILKLAKETGVAVEEEQSPQDIENQKLKDEVRALRDEISSLRTQLEDSKAQHQAAIEELKQDHRRQMEEAEERHRQEIVKLNQERLDEISKLKEDLGIDSEETPPTDFEEGQEVKVIYEGRVVTAEIKSEPHWDPGRHVWTYEVVVIGSDDTEILYPTRRELITWQELALPSEEPPVEITPPPEGQAGQWWLRTRGRIGDIVTGRSAGQRTLAAMQAYRYGRVRQVTEEEWYPNGSVEAGERAVGAVAVAAVLGGVVSYLIWGRHSGHNVVTHPVYPVYPGTPKGEHIDLVNSAAGHRLTGAELPKSLHLTKNLSGHYIVKNNLGQTVVSQHELPKGMFDRQGNFSRAARAVFRAKGYSLKQLRFGGRYMTEVI